MNVQHFRRATDKAFTILCIDDESASLRNLSNLFVEHYQVILCKTAESGYAKALEMRPDLILLDVVMPDMNGFELIQKIKATTSLAHTPIMFISARQTPDDEERGLLLGACDYIHKPFIPGIVKARVTTQLELVRQRKLLERFANFDILTEVPNRRKWQEDIDLTQKEKSQTKSDIHIGIIDVDCFKLYNDHYGHMQGDIVLRKIAKIVERTLYDFGGHIYRCGGEEFYFQIAAHTQYPLPTILTACRDAVRALKIQHERSVACNTVTISIGATTLHANELHHVDDAIKQADDALYHIKTNGRDDYRIVEFQTP